jgi:hypothetical protein
MGANLLVHAELVIEGAAFELLGSQSAEVWAALWLAVRLDIAARIGLGTDVRNVQLMRMRVSPLCAEFTVGRDSGLKALAVASQLHLWRNGTGTLNHTQASYARVSGDALVNVSVRILETPDASISAAGGVSAHAAFTVAALLVAFVIFGL